MYYIKVSYCRTGYLDWGWLKFFGKNLCLVGCATVCAKSEVMLKTLHDGLFFVVEYFFKGCGFGSCEFMPDLKKIRSQGPNKKLICSLLILDPDSMIAHIEPAMYVFGKALDSLKDSSDLTDLEKRSVVQSNVSCHGRGEVRWSQGKVMF